MPDALALKTQGPDTAGNPLPVYPATPGASGSTQTWKASANSTAATAITVSLTAEAGRTNFVTQVVLSTGGATAGIILDVTITGVIGGTLHIVYAVPTGALLAATPLVVNFNPPLQSTAVNQIVTLTMPTAGAGNTQQTAAIYGFSQ
jgi:hypothetical protein